MKTVLANHVQYDQKQQKPHFYKSLYDLYIEIIFKMMLFLILKEGEFVWNTFIFLYLSLWVIYTWDVLC